MLVQDATTSPTSDIFESLRNSADTTYEVAANNLELMRTNAGWDRFARENGGERILSEWYPGRSILDAISDVLRSFYRIGFKHAVESGLRWEHDYECSSGTTLRRFRMIAYPGPYSLVITHAPRRIALHDREIYAPSLDYVADGRITMCAHCRRVRNARHSNRWDWVPNFVEEPPTHLTQGLCPPCVRYYSDW